jgi:nucleotide-binding universal stress UspA family protein
MDSNLSNISSAVQDFHRARSKAMMKEIMARITGESIQLLSYDEVRKRLRAHNISERGLQEIPVKAIVGSLGRYNDFTRDFLPLRDSIKDRWTRIQMATTGLAGLPPIEVYQIGEIYFVKDGNHRVSVARQLGILFIQAYVTEVKTRIQLKPDDDPKDIIIKSEYSAFLEKTRLDELRPDSNLIVSIPGQYTELEEHISVHRYFMGIDQKREIPYLEAVTHWYDTIYQPVVKAIQDQGILRNFPGRTEADLYLWISNHRASLVREFGWEVKPETAIRLLVKRFDHSLGSVVSHVNEKLIAFLSRGKLLAGPPPGQWRKESLSNKSSEHLFNEILVPIGSLESGWPALEQAIIVANRERAVLHGLHVISSEDEVVDQPTLQEEFNKRCSAGGVQGDLIYAHGEIAQVICDKARATDLVITHLSYPPGPLPIDRLESGFHDMVQKCPRPILAIPQNSTSLHHGLLAFDASPKAEEALFISAYLAAQWYMTIAVIAINENRAKASKWLNQADRYLGGHGIKAALIGKTGNPSEAILDTYASLDCDFILMGGYGSTPIVEVVIGSVVDKILRESKVPIFICR